MWTVIIPVLAITEGTQVVVGNYFGERNYVNLKKVLITSLILVIVAMAIIAVGGIFFWNGMSTFFNQNPEMVNYSTATFWWLIIPYCLFAVSGILKSVFYGTGKTKYIFYVSAICNFGLIIPFWVLAQLGVIVASFNNVMALFVIVFAADLAITYPLMRKVLKETKTAAAPRNN
jgi:Na+-driven multidrug efflux pump